MKKMFSFALLLLSLKLGRAQQNDTLLVAFRSVNIENDLKVALRADVKTLSEISIKNEKGIFTLKKGSYRYVDSLGIEVNDKNKIMALTFRYGYDSNYVHEQVHFHEQKKYLAVFGIDGKHYEYKSDLLSIKVTRWEDKYTIFELVETIERGKILNYSRIFDKKLYYLQFQKTINFNKTENSIELLRKLGLLTPNIFN